jgi:hypothetical protein
LRYSPAKLQVHLEVPNREKGDRNWIYASPELIASEVGYQEDPIDFVLAI